MKIQWPFWISSFLVISSTVLLLHSFITIQGADQITTSKFSFKDDLPNDTPRLVFVVIDAFRLTFLTDTDSPMWFFRDSIFNGNAMAFDGYARMPTVTMPRIISFITGTLPSFGTLITNVATTEITTDNWVTRLKNNGKNVHFYGDDTWIRLLPTEFSKFDATTSFFVNDYTEVDNNVTRHLDSELKSGEWDAMILHYLGLDHIGHSLGGRSPKLRGKLKEMDGILKRIVEELEKTKIPTYVIVGGDHGMTAGGSHGGASPDESRVPIVIWPINQKFAKVPIDSFDNLEKVEQPDVSATIFSIFGMQSPTDSHGFSLTVGNLENESHLITMRQYYHFYELAKSHGIDNLFTLSCTEDSPCDFSKPFVQKLIKDECRRIQRKLMESSASIPSLQLAIFGSVIILAAIISKLNWEYESLLDVSVFILNIGCFASSFIEEEHEIWYYVTSSLIVVHFLKNFRSVEIDKQKTIFGSILLLLLLQRFCINWTSGMRRRWAMDQSLLPPPMFNEMIANFNIPDANTFFRNSPFISLAVSTIIWLFVCVSLESSPKLSGFMILFPLFSHLLRLFGYVNFDSGYLLACRILLIPFYLLTGKHTICVLCLVLIVIPTNQLLLFISIFLMGRLAADVKLEKTATGSMIMSTFYFSGNSNSFATIMLQSGYVGLLDYYPILVGIQLFLYTYAGPIIFVIGFYSSRRKIIPQLLSYFLTVRIINLFFSILCLYIFQNHLFVWSVYSPKVMYDLSHCIVVVIAGILLV
ncbi:unnamed protein product [Caenorhabditis angaria]|uniref:GPI ethanolamine phosphate transferase 2 C-terminal domain-containing protein n=1 Tax=Caenorhabditis angaria TaxID=860376 RepID=A0A9P1IBF0_9PELO|nr:unnamed protein product [Caenorhabditis angaria]